MFFPFPSLPFLIACFFVPVLTGWYIAENFRDVLSWLTFVALVCFGGWAEVVYLAIMFKEYERQHTDDGARRPLFDKPKPPAHPVPVNVYGKFIRNAETVEAVKIDCVRAFNRTLIEQRNGNLEVNLSEKFWLEKPEGEDAHRWNKIGGRGRGDLIDMLERGVKFGAYKKVGGQGKRVPDDWRKIRELERGVPLPHYSPVA